MSRQNVCCDQCEKYIGDEKLAWFSDAKEDLDFCSKDCYSEWNATTWTDIHPDFTREWQEEWQNKGFNYKQTKKWSDALDRDFEVGDYKFCAWLRDEKELTAKEIKDYEIDELIEEYKEYKYYLKIQTDSEEDESSETESEVSSSEDDSEELKEENKQLDSEEDDYSENSENDEYFSERENESDNENYVSTQTWLENQAKYNTKQKRAEVTKLLITKQLTGILDLSDFTNLEKIFIAQSVDASQFQITNQPTQVEIINNSWIDIHEKFSVEYDGKTIQQIWEEKGFTAQDAQTWIKAGFELYDLYFIQNWKNLNFTPDQVQEWRSIGLDKDDYELAYYCQTKQLTPAEVKDDLEQYRMELRSAQAYVDFFYPLANRSKIKKLDISRKKITGDLNLKGFNNLTELDCSDNKLTNLDLSDCSSLTELYCHHNNLTNLNFLTTLLVPEKLTKLYINSNNITSNLTPLSKLVNLQELDLNFGNNIEFYTNSSIELVVCPRH